MKRILLSAGMVVFLGAIVASGTGAFFSDSETSTGNVFAAGDIDLQIDNESYAIDHNIPGYDDPTGEFVANPANSWELVDLTIEKFFDFVDLKPGDYGEDTISVHVGSNDAWVCAAARVTEDLDNSITEPEDEVFGTNTDEDDGTDDGDLDSEVNFAFWVDDGDNVLETDEVQSVFADGSIADLDTEGQIALADSEGGIIGDEPIPGGEEFYIGKGWCFGEMTADPVTQDGEGKIGTNGPLARGTGFTCDGSELGNIAQTDSVEGDLQFYAEQARNNDDFLCSEWEPVWPTEEETTLTVTKVIVGGLEGDDASDFSFQVDGGAVTPFEGDGTNVVSVTPGAHDLSEVAPIGFTVAISGDCASDGTVNVAAGTNASCTITNTRVELE